MKRQHRLGKAAPDLQLEMELGGPEGRVALEAFSWYTPRGRLSAACDFSPEQLLRMRCYF